VFSDTDRGRAFTRAHLAEVTAITIVGTAAAFPLVRSPPFRDPIGMILQAIRGC
jgi:hypothetical protein